MEIIKQTIKLLFKYLSHSEVADNAQSVHEGLDANVLYEDPDPDLPTLQGYINILRQSIAAWGPVNNRGSHNDHLAVLAARAQVEEALVRLANFCEHATPYDGAAFATANWSVNNSRNPSEPLPSPDDLRQVYSKAVSAGGAKLKCNKVKGAKSYLFSRAPIAPETVPVIYPSSKSTVVVEDLERDTIYLFRVSAIGPLGRGAESDICEVNPQ